ncbi:CaiB/BaiF CoA transferase family protein [Atopomonas sediminilitoris]|uniref:CaiB/BaiF CoA transferase family protein n=1 Tax=Atopomonas sediminilitoris TaxID=2919919 RepID=UPI001F4D93BB|nr:CaiB/BaiF CoA-transferase family protein [Atopomonas sediminilitoris]MCJ8170037.1 CoA transferase [Atopomonas sediminilitoris]
MSAPLAGLKVLDFSTLLPGPFASMMLADMGAEVLRIESPTRMDLLRLLPPHDRGISASHAYLNRNKRSLALDLKKPEAIELVKRLVQDYDIVLDQFRPGVMDKLGVGYAALKVVNPQLIYCAITGYGQTGPYKDRAGHDINYLALSGSSSYTGRAEQGPLPLGLQVADVAGGSLHGVVGILAAVIKRQATGQGDFVDISMTDCAFSLNAMSAAGYLAAGVEPARESHALNGGSFYDYYQARDGQWFAVGSLEPQFMQPLCAALGKPELAKQGLDQRPEVQQQLKIALAQAFAEQDGAHWQRVFAEIDACVEPVLSLAEACEHPQIKARGLVQSVPLAQEAQGAQAQVACPIRFAEPLPAARFAGVNVGAHSQEVLGELGLSTAQITALQQAKVFG